MQGQPVPNKFQISGDAHCAEQRPPTPPVTSTMPLITGSNCSGSLPAEISLAVDPAQRDISKIVKNVAKPAPLFGRVKWRHWRGTNHIHLCRVCNPTHSIHDLPFDLPLVANHEFGEYLASCLLQDCERLSSLEKPLSRHNSKSDL